MRSKFFMYLLIALIFCAIGFFLWQVLKTIFMSAVDLKTGRELDKLADEFRDKRIEREKDAAVRLDNGCDHDFNDDGGAFPPSVCRRCGIALVHPNGECDHVWQRRPGIIPSSRCSKCGQEFTAVGGI